MIDAKGNQIGIMSARDAQALADQSGLDLIKISPNAKPPVCRIADYGKYRFEQAKREKEARKNQHVVDVKEVRLGLNTDVGDFNTKVNHAQRFIGQDRKSTRLNSSHLDGSSDRVTRSRCPFVSAAVRWDIRRSDLPP